MLVVGLTGKINSGKSTVAKYLVEKYNFHKVAFADPLKKMLIHAQILTEKDILKKTHYARQMLQKIGTDLFRNQVDRNFWVTKMRKTLNFLKETGVDKIVIDDIRFPNEYALVRDEFNGVIIKVIMVGPLDTTCSFNDHESELYVDTFEYDYLITNELGQIEQTYHQVDSLIAKILPVCQL